MSTLTLPPILATDKTLAARARTYAVLSYLFRYPGDAEIARFVSQEAPVTLRNLQADLPFEMPTFPEIFVATDPATLSQSLLTQHYTRLFDNSTGRARVSLHEKDHVSRDPQNLWEELIRFYEHFGLKYDLHACKDWPDWIGVQLEFMHYLTFLQAGLPPGQHASIVLAQADFMQRHLAEWVPRLNERLQAQPDHTPYHSLAAWLTAFIAADSAHVSQQKQAQQNNPFPHNIHAA